MALPRITPVSLSSPDMNMLSLENRIKSFGNRSPTYITVRDLAEAGYFSVNHPSECQLPDIVRCFHCGGYSGCWTRPCDPLVEHNRLSPYCEFARMKLRLRPKTPSAPSKTKKTKSVCRSSKRLKLTKKKLFVGSHLPVSSSSKSS